MGLVVEPEVDAETQGVSPSYQLGVGRPP